MMKRYVIEREMPGVGGMSPDELSQAAGTSCAVLADLAPRVQWEHSYVTGDKTFCVYLAEDEDAIRAHAARSGFPADVITEVTSILDPTNAPA